MSEKTIGYTSPSISKHFIFFLSSVIYQSCYCGVPSNGHSLFFYLCPSVTPLYKPILIIKGLIPHFLQCSSTVRSKFQFV